MRNHNSNSPEYHLDIIHDAQQLSNEQNFEIIDINSSTDNTNGKVYGLDSNLWLRDELDEHETTRHSWFDDDYNEQLNEEEVWFEAEERLDEPFYESTSNDFHQQNFSNENSAEEKYNESLCKCTSITRGEALLMTLLLGAQQSLPWTTIVAILSLINTLFGHKVVPESKYQLFKLLQLNDKMICYHMFCKDCSLYIGAQNNSNSEDLKCPNCGIEDNSSNISFFLTLDMETQLKTILQDSKVQEALIDRFEGKTKRGL
ncbi:uncharacterized protein LOC123270986 [Cotesia glomerata]|uniref:uncharacterized protein LOC123270986 n=1 Tax=Cotesia glomerata TaxID=32391 RepID=UPI001D015AE7|nr:uncharacterized protein LOC123270986 [Cotesia glomerata]XP_044593129.1 uncharacterized protein LOC123270986 [Cotesia glomerata]